MSLTDELKKYENGPENKPYFPGSPEHKAEVKARELDRKRKRLTEALFTWESEVENEPDIAFINNTPTCSLTNLSLSLALRKAGKSTVISLFVGDRSNVFRISLPSGKDNIMIVDTEQSGKFIRKMQDRISHLYGSKPRHVQFLRLRKYSKKERMEFIKLAIECTPNMGMLIIDNIKDVCQDFNDPAEADKVATLLIQWAQEYNIHIMCVLHLNKGNGLSRGHLGSELENKAETVFKIRKDDQQNLVIVEPEATRGAPFEPVGFFFDNDGMPVIQTAEAMLARKQDSKIKVDPWQFSAITHENILDEVFKKADAYGYEEMWKAIKNIAQRHSISLGNNKATEWLTYYKTEGLVKQNEKRKYIKKEL
jgi:hypothetical protein